MPKKDSKPRCVTCGTVNDGYTEISGSASPPSDGDYSICAYCGTVSAYVVTEKGFTFRVLTDKEKERAYANEDVKTALRVLGMRR